MFVDHVDIHVTAGDGGRGCMAFRREKYVPRGGPSGGDGGDGGSIYVVASPHTNTLVNYRFHPEFVARRGGHGQGSNRTGRRGADLELPVPVGTLVYEKTGDADQPCRPLADLTREGDRVLVARGGRGGLGNARFATATNRAPRRTQPGEPGEDRQLRLELKLLADVGLVGFPNAGKSTLIARVSAARPKIADYPFTTLHPNLGVVRAGDVEMVIADIPGLIEGAHDGAGLGTRFLGHVEKCRVLLHLVDATETMSDVVTAYRTVRAELKAYSGELARRREIIALTKCDAITPEVAAERAAALQKAARRKPMLISAVSGQGIQEALFALLKEVGRKRVAEESAGAGQGGEETPRKWQP
jgi:GTP-binding protein